METQQFRKLDLPQVGFISRVASSFFEVASLGKLYFIFALLLHISTSSHTNNNASTSYNNKKSIHQLSPRVRSTLISITFHIHI
jgi:hypothetical protein